MEENTKKTADIAVLCSVKKENQIFTQFFAFSKKKFQKPYMEETLLANSSIIR